MVFWAVAPCSLLATCRQLIVLLWLHWLWHYLRMFTVSCLTSSAAISSSEMAFSAPIRMSRPGSTVGDIVQFKPSDRTKCTESSSGKSLEFTIGTCSTVWSYVMKFMISFQIWCAQLDTSQWKLGGRLHANSQSSSENLLQLALSEMNLLPMHHSNEKLSVGRLLAASDWIWCYKYKNFRSCSHLCISVVHSGGWKVLFCIGLDMTPSPILIPWLLTGQFPWHGPPNIT